MIVRTLEMLEELPNPEPLLTYGQIKTILTDEQLKAMYAVYRRTDEKRIVPVSVRKILDTIVTLDQLKAAYDLVYLLSLDGSCFHRLFDKRDAPTLGNGDESAKAKNVTEYVCPSCGQVHPDLKTKYCHKCGWMNTQILSKKEEVNE